MAGISSKAAGGMQNKRGFNGGNELQSKEFADGSGLEMYDATNRMYDPQLGRFGQLDEFGEVTNNWSPYVFASDNPISRNDPFGLKDTVVNGEHGSTSAPLQEVVVTARHTEQNLQNTYWDLVHRGISFDRVKDKGLSNWLYRNERIQNYLDRVHDATREQGLLTLEVASYFIPIGEFVNIGRLGKAALNLFGLKRGLVAGRVFWSGGIDVAGKAAMDFAKANGMQTLEMTMKGKLLTALTNMTSYDLTRPLWEKASASFAQGAEGSVHVFQNATDGVRLNSVWRNIEYNGLKNNGNEMIYHDVIR